MPEDIRQEIEAERQKRNLRSKQEQSEAKKPISTSPTRENDSINQQNVSFSQFDASVLAQLPENIVNELKQEYTRK